jgi:hypothetical protein
MTRFIGHSPSITIRWASEGDQNFITPIAAAARSKAAPKYPPKPSKAAISIYRGSLPRVPDDTGGVALRCLSHQAVSYRAAHDSDGVLDADHVAAKFSERGSACLLAVDAVRCRLSNTLK